MKWLGHVRPNMSKKRLYQGFFNFKNFLLVDQMLRQKYYYRNNSSWGVGGKLSWLPNLDTFMKEI